MTRLESRATVGVLGGGQLGRMLGAAGLPLGVACRFLDPAPGAPAAAVGPVHVGALDDILAARRAMGDAPVVTYEWEGVPAATATALAADALVFPGANALDVSQDRLAEKQCFERLGIEVAPHRESDTRAVLDAALRELGTPAILKTRRGGYDGKGQVRITSPAVVDAAWEAIGGPDLILEQFVDFTRELSVIAVRGRDGEIRTWPLIENHHRDGILRVSIAPAPHLTRELQAEADDLAAKVLSELDYVGVLTIELFATAQGLVANEMAPRVHNSGHWTIEGATTSQFENHLRAILGWPLGECGARGSSAMVNVIGAWPDRAGVLAVAGAHWHDYEKSSRRGRKLGHITVTAPDDATRDERLAAVLVHSRDDG
jgi:5-(carboxyamino)imidazole ribonucleotide synthase